MPPPLLVQNRRQFAHEREHERDALFSEGPCHDAGGIGEAEAGFAIKPNTDICVEAGAAAQVGAHARCQQEVRLGPAHQDIRDIE